MKRENRGMIVCIVAAIILSIMYLTEGSPKVYSIIVMTIGVGIPIIMKKNDYNMFKASLPVMLFGLGVAFLCVLALLLGKYFGVM